MQQDLSDIALVYVLYSSPEAYFSLDHYTLMSNMRSHYRVNYAHAHIPSAELGLLGLPDPFPPPPF